MYALWIPMITLLQVTGRFPFANQSQKLLRVSIPRNLWWFDHFWHLSIRLLPITQPMKKKGWQKSTFIILNGILQSPLWQLLWLITPQHIVLPLYHQKTHKCDIQAFDNHCLGPRPNCLYLRPDPDLIAYLLSIFNWSWSSYTFPSCWYNHSYTQTW